jgi:hypothetical protein
MFLRFEGILELKFLRNEENEKSRIGFAVKPLFFEYLY